MKTWVKALMVGALVLGPAAAFAAIDNTHHDMPYITTAATAEKCTYCHSITGLATSNTALGKVGNFCVVVCHNNNNFINSSVTNGGTIPTSPGTYGAFTPNADLPGAATYGQGTFAYGAADATATIFTAGHQMDKSVLAVNFAGEATAVTATAWPYTGGTELQCTSCHAIHDATNPPFLNAKLSDGTQTGGFCQRCHNDAGRRTDITVAAGPHPIEFMFSATAANARLAGANKTDTTKMGNRDLINLAPTILNQVGTNVTPATAGSLNATNAIWNMGGHVVNTTTGLATTGAVGTAGNDQFGCYSCHTVHVSATATSPFANILAAGTSLTTVCYGCHTAEPGRTGYGHPIDFESVHAETRTWGLSGVISGNYTTINAMYRPATVAQAPLCVTCHAVHSRGTGANVALTGRMAIRTIGTLPADGSACEMCHPSSFGNPTVANRHHPGAAGTDYRTNGFAQNTGWFTVDGNGDLDDGLACADCHVGDGNSTKRSSAHNWQ